MYSRLGYKDLIPEMINLKAQTEMINLQALIRCFPVESEGKYSGGFRAERYSRPAKWYTYT